MGDREREGGGWVSGCHQIKRALASDIHRRSHLHQHLRTGHSKSDFTSLQLDARRWRWLFNHAPKVRVCIIHLDQAGGLFVRFVGEPPHRKEPFVDD